MSNTKIIIAALTDQGNVRTNNEDNFVILADVQRPEVKWPGGNRIDLGEYGSLLVVADGMGGMNAGEVASGIAVNVVEAKFRNLQPTVLKSTATIQNFMSSVVVEADKTIKAKSTSETRGMGTTIVMAWLYNGYAYVCWCGDSRAYLFNNAYGLKRISKDHSLVQSLVDNHKITDDEAFDSPQSNIITRCLSDSQNNAKPENAEPVELSNGDVVMLCSDGLCGMIRDRDIVQVMRSRVGDGITKMVDELVAAAKRAGGKDNVTVAAAIVSNDKDPVRVHAANEAPMMREPSVQAQNLQQPQTTKPAWMWMLIGMLVMALIGMAIWMWTSRSDSPEVEVTEPEATEEVQESPTPTPQSSHAPNRGGKENRQSGQTTDGGSDASPSTAAASKIPGTPTETVPPNKDGQSGDKSNTTTPPAPTPIKQEEDSAPVIDKPDRVAPIPGGLSPKKQEGNDEEP